MTRITAQEVKQIAQLARLELTTAELAEIRHDLEAILEHIRALAEVDTQGVLPMGGVSEHPAPMRPDTPGADPLHLSLDEIAPAREESFFLVPRLAALDGDARIDEEGDG